MIAKKASSTKIRSLSVYSNTVRTIHDISGTVIIVFVPTI